MARHPLSDIADIHIGIKFANMAKANKMRAWAKRNKASVQLSRFARDAYEGRVVIYSPWDENRSIAEQKAAEFRKLFL